MPEVPSTPSHRSIDVDHVLTLQCPFCNGTLFLKPEHVEVAGQCVHCQRPILAIQTVSGVQIIEYRSSQKESMAQTVEPPTTKSEGMDHTPSSPIGADVPSPSSDSPDSSENPWGFPLREKAAMGSDDVALSATDDSGAHWDFDDPIPTRDGDDLFSGRPSENRRSSVPSQSPFDRLEELFSRSEASTFTPDPEELGISSSWGTQIPAGKHASISPFGTGSADGASFADDLYLEKVQKENAEASARASQSVDSTPPSSYPPTASDLAFGMPVAHNSSPLPPSTLPVAEALSSPVESRIEDGSAIFSTKPAGRSRVAFMLMLKIITGLSILALTGTTSYILIPRETMISWKNKALEWLEPGSSGIKLLPEVLKSSDLSPTGSIRETQSSSKQEPAGEPRQNPFTKSEIPSEYTFD